MAQLINAQSELSACGVMPIPILFSKEWDYLEPENRYLRAMASGHWVKGKWITAFAERKPKASLTVLAYAKDMVDFRSYQEVRIRTWETFSNPSNLLDEYFEDTRDGNWKAAGKDVCIKTCRRRQLVNADFFRFLVASDVIKAPEAGSMFEQAKEPSRPRVGRKVRGVAGTYRGVRRGRVRIDPDELTVPTAAEVDEWQQTVSRHNHTLGEACHAIIEAGFRRNEARLYRAEDLPATLPPDGEDVEITIQWGAKGAKRPNDPNQKGKRRKAVVSHQGIARLLTYRDKVRPSAIKAFRARNPGQPEPKELFLNDRTGKPFSEHQLYRAWTAGQGGGAIGAGWSPHSGRHLYALRTALRALKDEANAVGDEASNSLRTLKSILTLVVQPSLGHEDFKTTLRYLTWFRRALRNRGLARACARFLGE